MPGGACKGGVLAAGFQGLIDINVYTSKLHDTRKPTTATQQSG